MADKPMLFSAPMIRALLDGRKTQTRRVLKIAGRKPEYIGPKGCTDDPTCWGWDNGDAGGYITVVGDEKDHLPGWRNGWRDWAGAYAIGDRIWVREAFRVCEECGYYDQCEDANSAGTQSRTCCRSCDAILPKRKRPSIHMPRWASRLTLTVTDVRVQRLKEIRGEDCIAEGVSCETCAASWSGGRSACNQRGCFEIRQNFRDLWDSIHGRDAWAANPWVCALTFTVHRCNIDKMPG